jgi:hypothetical protein
MIVVASPWLRTVVAFALLLASGCHHTGGSGGTTDAGESEGGSDMQVDLRAEEGSRGPDASGEVGAADATGSDEASALGCDCPPGDYFLEVKSTPGSAVVVDQTWQAPFMQTPIPDSCVPAVPWSFYDEPMFNLYACRSADQTRDCIQLSVGAPAGGFYLGAAGERATLTHPPVQTDFVRGGGRAPPAVVSGSYTATATAADGTRFDLHGNFRVCVSTRRLLLFRR